MSRPGLELGPLVEALLHLDGDVNGGRHRRRAAVRGGRFQLKHVVDRLVELLVEGNNTSLVVPLEILEVLLDANCRQVVLDPLISALVNIRGRYPHDFLSHSHVLKESIISGGQLWLLWVIWQLASVYSQEKIKSHLRDGHIVDGAVEDRGVVIDILDFDPQGAHVLERRPTLVRRLHRHEDQLLAVGLVAVEDLKERTEGELVAEDC